MFGEAYEGLWLILFNILKKLYEIEVDAWKVDFL